MMPLLEDPNFWLFVALGFGAQIVDGALGMAFGAICAAVLGTMGMAPSLVSASIHLSETFTTAASGLSHMWARNIDWKLFKRLAPAGVIGGILGATILSRLDGAAIKPFILAYLALVGIAILWKGLRRPSSSPYSQTPHPARTGALGFVGALVDAIGGGGWGPIVTSSLIARGHPPRTTIGAVNLTEFFVTLAISLTFLVHLGLQAFTVIAGGLILGGVVAAPLGALLVRHLPTRALLLGVGALVTGLSIGQLL